MEQNKAWRQESANRGPKAAAGCKDSPLHEGLLVLHPPPVGNLHSGRAQWGPLQPHHVPLHCSAERWVKHPQPWPCLQPPASSVPLPSRFLQVPGASQEGWCRLAGTGTKSPQGVFWGTKVPWHCCLQPRGRAKPCITPLQLQTLLGPNFRSVGTTAASPSPSTFVLPPTASPGRRLP